MLTAIGQALASIPWYGWVGLAILAGVGSAQSAASSSTTSMNLGRSPDSYYSTPTGMGLPSYDVGAWSINGDQFAKVHDGELIAPAKGGVADSIRGMLTGQLVPATAAAGPRVNNYFNASAMDTRGIDRVFRNNARHVTQSLYKVSRTLAKPNQSKWGTVK